MSEKKQPEIQEPPEDSIPFRVVCLAMGILCVTASCLFVRTHLLMIVLYGICMVAGSFLSYKHRHEDPKFMKVIWWTGILAVGGFAIHDFTGPLRDEFDFVSPFAHFLAGVFVFLTFSMKTRSDLNLSSGLGLVLLCIASPVAKGLSYGALILAYLCLGAAMLYFDCVSRTISAWLARPIARAPEVPMYSRNRRLPRGNTIMLVMVIPLAALCMFLFVPRADKFLDEVWAYAKTMDLNFIFDALLGPSKPNSSPNASLAQRTHSSREWFDKNTDVMKNVKEKEEEEKRAEKKKRKEDNEDKAPLNRQKADMKTKDITSHPNIARSRDDIIQESKKKQEMDPHVAEMQMKEKEVKAQSKPDAKTNKSEKDKSDKGAGKEAEQKDKSKDSKKDPGKDKAGGKASAAGKSGSEDKAKGSNANSADKPKQQRSPSTPPAGAEEREQTSAENAENQAGGGSGKKGGRARSKSASGEGDGTGGGGSGRGRRGGGGKTGGEHGGGKYYERPGGPGKQNAPANSSKSSAGKGTNAGDVIGAGGDQEIDLENKFEGDQSLVLTVKSRRIIFLRRQCYDFYTGNTWKKSAEPKKEKIRPVRVVDGILQRELDANSAVVQNAISTPPVQPAVAPASPGNILAPAQSTADLQQSGVILNKAQPQAVKVDQSGPIGGAQPADSKYAGVRPYVFERKEERPIFRVGMADSLRTQPALPTVDLLQEITIKAKTLGKTVPAGWIPTEVKVDQDRVQVDKLGVISLDKTLERGTEIKVKTELPIYPLDVMRKMPPISVEEEDAIRNENSQYLQLPKSTSEETLKLAEDTADPSSNWFVQCEQIARYLRKNYDYDALRAVSPDCPDMVQEFLFERKTGHCTDFASAFVVLTRCVGIPSRVVTGYAPGDLNPVTGEREVHMKDAHAWAEAYIPKYGWVPFDATPTGFLPAQQREETYSIEEVKKQFDFDPDNVFGYKLTDIIACVLGTIFALVVLFFTFRALIPMLINRWKNRVIRGPEWKMYKSVARNVKRSIKLTRMASETPTEYMQRVRELVNQLKQEGKNPPEGLPDAVETFMKIYSEVYFGQRRDQMENLRYHAEQVARQSRTKVKFDAESSTAVRSKATADAATKGSEKKGKEDTRVESAIRRKK